MTTVAGNKSVSEGTMNSNKESGAASSSANAAPSVLSVPASVAAHTAGPWSVSDYTVSGATHHMTIWDRGSDAVMFLDQIEGNKNFEAMSANAARIVAAVNYCEGLTNEQLADGRESYVGMAFDFERMRASNAELAAALRGLLDSPYVEGHGDEGGPHHCSTCDAIERAERALSNLKEAP